PEPSSCLDRTNLRNFCAVILFETGFKIERFCGREGPPYAPSYVCGQHYGMLPNPKLSLISLLILDHFPSAPSEFAVGASPASRLALRPRRQTPWPPQEPMPDGHSSSA